MEYKGLHNQIALGFTPSGILANNLITRKFSGLMHDYSNSSDSDTSSSQTDSEKTSGRQGVSKKRLVKFLLLTGLAVLIIFTGVRVASYLAQRVNQVTDPGAEVMAAKATNDINKEYNFPLKDKQGKEVGNIKFVVERAELRDEILVKGQKATAIKGRVFLILNLRITNEFGQAIEMDTRDYIRLSTTGEDGERLAPDIHNDPVEIQAISTKPTRVGFPINESDKDLILWIGEINGDKDKITLSF